MNPLAGPLGRHLNVLRIAVHSADDDQIFDSPGDEQLTVPAEGVIEYQHVRALGNPKPYRDLYKAGRIAEGERRYRKHLHNGSYGALIELGETLDDEPTCIQTTTPLSLHTWNIGSQ